MELEEQNSGGGSGGDTGMDSSGNQIKSASGTYQIGGNQVVLVSRASLPPATAGPSRIILLAGGSAPSGFMDDGMVDVRGTKGVRVTAGPPTIPLISPATTQEATDGVDVIVSEDQAITLRRGLVPMVDQRIELTSDGILIDAGVMGTLTLRAGLSEITIDVTGITITGMPLVQINPGPPGPPSPPDPPEEYVPPILPPGEMAA